MLFWEQLQAWIESEAQESPALVVGAPNARWDDFLIDLKNRIGLRPEDILEMDRENHAIKIKEVREMLSRIHATSFSGKRLIIIPEAERLRRETANALLKELEESSHTNRWLLTTGYRGRLLPTIISRCQIMRISNEYVIHEQNKHPVFDLRAIEGVIALNRKKPLNDMEVEQVSQWLQQLVSVGRMDANIQRALLRLRDYHKIRALGGNDKLASDVLVASLTLLSKNIE